MNHIYGKNVFITGGSSGIGLSTAELFAANGYTVYSGSRAPSTEIRGFPGGGEIRPIVIDVCCPQSTEAAAKYVLDNADIGIIIHCAGIGIACPGEDFPQDTVSELFETNLYGVLRVNSLFLPALRKRGGGLCVIIGSVAAVYSIPFQAHYCASKAAVYSYAKALRMEMRDFGVRVSLVSPGDTSTGFTNSRKYELLPDSPYYKACLASVKKMEKDEQSGRAPSSVARVILKLCSNKNPPGHKIVGGDYKLLVFLRRLLPERIIELILRSIYLKQT